jgi:putative radical SAM enzyme (TIGR03279 family)
VREKGIAVGRVHEGSIAQQVEIEKGDVILSINGRDVQDILDYHFYTRDELVSLGLLKTSGEIWEIDIEKDADQDIGVEFSRTGLEAITPCANKCLFCFVDQMPGHMRESLYIKDDDYRLSFLQGSFITLTNLSQKSLRRIAQLKLSPLYVSVHATSPELRRRIMGNPRAGKIISQIEYLIKNGIEIHTQAVICPGVNDGAELERTVSDLAGLWPGVRSLAVVPVGLTGCREDLYPLKTFGREEAAAIVNKIKGWQDGCLKSFQYPFVFASDEFYFLSGQKIPPRSRYADFPQTENGVGLARLFMDEWSRAKKRLPGKLASPQRIVLVTGVLGKKLLEPVTACLNGIENLSAEALEVKNNFFGHTVTVAGLLTGRDILKHKATLSKSDMVVLPSSLLKKDQGIMLDGTAPADIGKAAGVAVRLAEGPSDLVHIIRKAAGA